MRRMGPLWVTVAALGLIGRCSQTGTPKPASSEPLASRPGAIGAGKAMVESHQDLAAKLESRLDVQSLADWKTAAAARAHSKALPEPDAAMRDVQVRPDPSDRDVTGKINQWAAATYPLAQKHLDTARTLEAAAKHAATE